MSKSTNKIVFRFPVKDAGIEVKEVTMRRAKVKDMRIATEISDSDGSYETILLGNLCGLSPEAMDEVDQYDYAEMQSVYKSFLAPPAVTQE